MNEQVQKVADAWDEISKEAKDNVATARDEFQKRAVLVGGLTVIAGGFVTAFDGGPAAQMMTGGFPLLFLLAASKETYLKTHFYNAMSSWALDKRDQVIESNQTARVTKPRFDTEEIAFNKEYKQPGFLKTWTNFRSLAVVSAITASLAAYGTGDVTVTLFDRNRKEGADNEHATGSEFAPMTSPRPLPRPSWK